MLIKTADFNVKSITSSVNIEEIKELQQKIKSEDNIELVLTPRKAQNNNQDSALDSSKQNKKEAEHTLNEIKVKVEDNIRNTGYNTLRVQNTGGLNLVISIFSY